LIRREVVRLSPHQKVALECVYGKEGEQSPTDVCGEFNNTMRLDGREEVSNKTLSELIVELECTGLLRWNEKGKIRAEALNSISLLQDLFAKSVLDALKDLVV
jgi:hypothetical protein